MCKIKTIQARLQRRKIDAILISQPDNRFYLSSFSARDYDISESSGYLLIPRSGTPLLLTDFRYQEQAERECSNFEVMIYKNGLWGLLARLCKSLNLCTLAFESHYFLYEQALRLKNICQDLHIALLPISNLVEKLRVNKSHLELDLIRRSVRLNERVFQEIYPTISAADTEIDVALRLENAMRTLGATGPSFATIVASGPNAAMPHAVPSRHKIVPGVPLIIDMGLVLAGYCSDMTRSIVLGTPTPQTVNIFRIVRQAQLTAIKAISPGTLCKDVDAAARSIISANGFGANFGHSLGHGVGVAVHEEPRLGPRCAKKLRAGMVVTIEPGIYIPGWGGVRLENMAGVTVDGCEIFNNDKTFLDI
ncbi:MAG: aminopeptidase P family protein [Deltaproteobacteria bacterium]|nr:aminopeptidase P family protein [Deltaproteobacteria bacterium]